jgi:preprotein translocase subunit YajC
MFTSLFLLLADEQGKAADGGSPLETIFHTPILPVVAIAFIGYFLLLRPMKRQEAERQALLNKMKKNDEILTTGGIYGTIIEVPEKDDKVILKIADNVRVKITKAAIARNLTNEEEAAKAKQPATKEGAA